MEDKLYKHLSRFFGVPSCHSVALYSNYIHDYGNQRLNSLKSLNYVIQIQRNLITMQFEYGVI